MMYRKRFGVARKQEDGMRYIIPGGGPSSHLWTKEAADAKRFEWREAARWVADQAGEGARVVEIFDFVDEQASYRQLEGVCHEMLMALRLAEAMIRNGPDQSQTFVRNAIEQAEIILGIGDRP